MDISAPKLSLFHVYGIEPIEHVSLIENLYVECLQHKGITSSLTAIQQHLSLASLLMLQLQLDTDSEKCCISLNEGPPTVVANSAIIKAVCLHFSAMKEQEKRARFFELSEASALNISQLLAIMGENMHLSPQNGRILVQYLADNRWNIMVFVTQHHDSRFTALQNQQLSALLPHLTIAFNVVERLRQAAHSPQLTDIQRILGVSLAEASVCFGLLQKKCLKEVAREKNISIHTVREQLRQVFIKTGLHSQKDVVAAILKASL